MRQREREAGWRACVLTILPDVFPGPLGASLAGRALDRGLWALETIDIRRFATDRHLTVDGSPAGGGPGMVMRPDVTAAAIDFARPRNPFAPTLYLSPRGQPLTQERVRVLAAGKGVIVLCGRFEGVDERVIESRELEEVSIGDFILSGGEIAAIALIDACVRLLPGVIGKAQSTEEESFEQGLLEYPQYTPPAEWESRTIPDVLRSGDHGRVAAWRREQSERLTRTRRPDLWARYKDRKPDPDA